MSELRELVQDLRANAHRCPEDLRPLIRRAASAIEASDEIVGYLGPPPFAPPAEELADATHR